MFVKHLYQFELDNLLLILTSRRSMTILSEFSAVHSMKTLSPLTCSVVKLSSTFEENPIPDFMRGFFEERKGISPPKSSELER